MYSAAAAFKPILRMTAPVIPNTPEDDGKGAKGIKYRLPGIAGRIAYSDSADESQHGMKVCRQNEIEPQENERSYQIENASLLCPLYHILFKGKAHGHTGNSGHMALGSPRRDAIKSVVERHKVSLIYHLFLRENGLNSWNRWLKFRLWTRCL